MDAILQLNTALAGRYAVEREIGKGGMATVYLARDLKHERNVALKLLNPELGAVLGVERFLSEIRVTANLQHPNLLPLFDSGATDGLLFYVMPYVDGESLRAKLAREKQLPVDEAIRLGVAVASALGYAHRHGVIHRDLKPENILLHEGQPLVADFGIALAVSNAGGERITQTGLSLGTPQYMSPEQATGDRTIDARSDIYSLAAVLYEALTGDPPYVGSTAQAIIAKVLTEKPRSVRSGRDTVPPNVDAALERALSKLPADRFATAQEFGDALQNASFATAASFAPAGAGAAPRRIVQTVAPWAVAAVGITAAILWPRRAAVDLPTALFGIPIPPAARIDVSIGGFLAVSPDGKRIAYVAQSGSGSQIAMRALDDLSIRLLPGTEGGVQPCFSLDGAWLAFNTGDKLKKVSVSGGSPVTIASLTALSRPAGCAWAPDGRIVLGSVGPALWAVPQSGGVPTRITAPDQRTSGVSYRGPALLDDGRTIAFTRAEGAVADWRLAFAAPNGRVTVTAQPGLRSVVVGGALVFATAEGALMVARIDARHPAVENVVPVFDNVYVRGAGYAAFDLSRNGTLVMLRGAPSSRVMLVDRTGAVQPLVADLANYRRPRASPDGQRIAVEVSRGGIPATDIWMYSRASQTLSRFTTGGGKTDPAWSTDGSRLAFTVHRDTSSADIYWQPADGSAAAQLLQRDGRANFAFWWDVRSGALVYDESGRDNTTSGVADIKLARPAGGPATRLLPAGTVGRIPSISPDGKWIAYSSSESGRSEIYVSTFPAAGPKWQVSVSGGEQPLWAHNGHELFYRDPRNLMVAEVATTPSFAVLARRTLFEDAFQRENTIDYDVMPDDQHFVMLKSADEAVQLVVVANWLPELRARLSASGR